MDTLDLAEGSQHQLGFMTQKNAERVERQRRTPITVVIGNPPYNMNQQNENDNNKNRKYDVIDKRVAGTYAKESVASNKTALSDPYVKFFRWATDRLQGRDGIVCFVSNNSFVDQHAFDGMRKLLVRDFTTVYHVDLHGNVRRNPKLSGTTHNVFGIQVGVGITVAVRRQGLAPCLSGATANCETGHTAADGTGLRYYRVPEGWRKEEKLGWLARLGSTNSVQWASGITGNNGPWIQPEHADEFASFIPMASKSAKGFKLAAADTIFKAFSVGVKTNRDDVVYDFQAGALEERVRRFIENYNAELDRYNRCKNKKPVDEFVVYDKIKWSRDLKLDLQRGNSATFEVGKIRTSLYRAFSKRFLFFDRILNEEVYVMPHIFPTPEIEEENLLICCTIDSQMPFSALAADLLPSHAPGGRPGQCFPFYVYDEDGSNRRENITDWAQEQFRKEYKDKKITKWDIFYYVYGILHHPEYREKYAENLKRELPRIPLAKDFWGFSKAGKELARLHIEYESLEPWPLRFIETTGVAPGLSPARAARKGGGAVAAVSDRRPAVGTPPLQSASVAASLPRHGGVKPPLQKAERRSAPQNADLKVGAAIPLSYRLEDKMRLAKDHRSLKVNGSLTLGGIPPETFEYRLGNRSALEWVIDQYQVTEDKHSGIRSDPNRPDDPEYIVRLVGQVIRVSVETMKVVKSLPTL